MREFIETGLGIKTGPAQFMGWGRGGELVAVVCFHNYDSKAGVIEISSYSSRRDWANRDTIREIFAYPFDQLGVRLCAARNAETNLRARRIWRSFGATEHIIPDLWADGVGECVHILHRETWRNGKFMRDNHG